MIWALGGLLREALGATARVVCGPTAAQAGSGATGLGAAAL
jgi:hypothetical protein